MKQCSVHPAANLAAYLFLLVLMTGTVVFSCHLLTSGAPLTMEESRMLILIVLLLMMVTVSVTRRVMCLGRAYLKYDDF